MVLPLHQQEGIRQADQRDVIMPALPAASLEVIQPQLLFQLLIVLFHPPAQLGQLHQAPERAPRAGSRTNTSLELRPLEATRGAARLVPTRAGPKHSHARVAPRQP